MMTDRAMSDAAPVRRGRYGRVAMALHWTIALLIYVQIGLGWYFNEVAADHSPQQKALVGVHISVGLTILLLVLVRIAWRLTHPAPPLPPGMPAWERILANAVHLTFYVLMLVLPLTGWAIASLGKDPILLWGIPWPHLPGIAGVISDKPSRESLQHFHVYVLIWITLINLALHIAGGLKHQFDGRPVLWRMIPFLKPRVPAAY